MSSVLNKVQNRNIKAASALKMEAVYSSETLASLPTNSHGTATQKTNIDVFTDMGTSKCLV
jgi:hypothetical protein